MVLMGQEDGGDILWRDARLPQPADQRAGREARVNQDRRPASLDQQRVAAAAAAQRYHSHWLASSCWLSAPAAPRFPILPPAHVLRQAGETLHFP